MWNKRKSPEEYLKDFRNLVEKNGAKLLSTKWLGATKKHLILLENNKEVEIVPHYIKAGWPKIFKTNKDYLQELNDIAEANGGKLLSTEWLGCSEKYRFQHASGIIFERRADIVKGSKWPQILKNDEYYLQELKDIAEMNGGKLLSKEWKGCSKKYLFLYSNGTQFEANPRHIKERGWPNNIDDFLCYSNSKINNEEFFLRQLENIAKINNGKLISKKWLGHKEKHLFVYSNGVEFEMSLDYFKRNSWPKNINSYLYNTTKHLKKDEEYLKEMRNIAKTNGGNLLSAEWKGTKEKYKFIDSNSTEFEIYYYMLKIGVWNPERGLVSEPICRQAINYIFGYEFKKTKSILTAKVLNRKHPLEFDGYCKQLNIAFEYQGYPSHWDINHRNYLETKERDDLKKSFCKKLGVLLIEIPPFKSNSTKWNSMEVLKHVLDSINKSYAENNMILPVLNTSGFEIELKNINHNEHMLEDLRIIAKNNKGKLISNKWKGNEEKYVFELEDGRRFEKKACILKMCGWPKDFELLFKTDEDYLQELRDIAEANNGKLLSTKYIGVKEKYLFQLPDGRTFERAADTLKFQGWPKNIKQLLHKGEHYLQELKSVAEANGGKLLSTEWKGAMAKYLFEFSDGRKFEQIANNITCKSRGWPKSIDYLIKTDEDYLQELRDIAEANNGKLLSTKHIGVKEKYLFEFFGGQKFEMEGSKIKSRGWPKDINQYLKRNSGQKKRIKKEDITKIKNKK